jgi:hypothetical protein
MAAAMMGKNKFVLEAAQLAADVHDAAFPFNFIGFAEFSKPLIQLPGFKKILEKSGIPLHDKWREIGLV